MSAEDPVVHAAVVTLRQLGIMTAGESHRGWVVRRNVENEYVTFSPWGDPESPEYRAPKGEILSFDVLDGKRRGQNNDIVTMQRSSGDSRNGPKVVLFSEVPGIWNQLQIMRIGDVVYFDMKLDPSTRNAKNIMVHTVSEDRNWSSGRPPILDDYHSPEEAMNSLCRSLEFQPDSLSPYNVNLPALVAHLQHPDVALKPQALMEGFNAAR